MAKESQELAVARAIPSDRQMTINLMELVAARIANSTMIRVDFPTQKEYYEKFSHFHDFSD